MLFCDVDNPGHVLWTDETAAEAIYMYQGMEILKTAGVYHTAHGARVVQPLAKPIPVQEVEPYIRRWFLELEQAGLRVDWPCRDWTRHFRLPHVRRDGARYRSSWMNVPKTRPS